METDLRKFDEGRKGDNIVKFASNWGGKLGKKFFTTIRGLDHSNYYEQRIGEVFEVKLEGYPFGYALLHDAHIVDFASITPELLVLDTGTLDYKKIFEKFHIGEKCLLLLFETVEGGK